MIRVLVAMALMVSLSACVVAEPIGGGYHGWHHHGWHRW